MDLSEILKDDLILYQFFGLTHISYFLTMNNLFSVYHLQVSG